MHIIDVTSEVKKNGFGEFSAVDPVMVAEMTADHGYFVDVEHFLPVIGSSFEGVGIIRYNVVQRGKHLCVRDAT